MISAYRINIALNLVSNSSSASRSIVRELFGIETAAHRVRNVMGALGIGFGIAEGVREMVKATSEYGHELEVLKLVIRDNKQMADAVKAAWSVSYSVPTSTASDNLKAIGDLVPAFGNVKDAINNIESLQKLNAVISNFGGKPDQVFDIAKALETRGAASDPTRFNKEAGMMVQATEDTHGRVAARDYLQFIRQANPFATGFSNDFLYKIAPTLMQDMGGSRAGTAVTSFENTLVGGRMTKAAKGLFQQFGLLDGNAAFSEGSAGTVQLKGSRVKGSDLALSDPNRWVNEVLVPALDRHGFTTAKQQEEVMAKLFSNRNSQRIAVEFHVNQGRYAKDAGIIGQTENPFKAFDNMKDNDPKMLGVEIWSQLQDVLVNIGKDALPHVLGPLQLFRDALIDLNKVLNGDASLMGAAFNGAIRKPISDAFAPRNAQEAAVKHGIADFLVMAGILDKKSAAPPSSDSSSQGAKSGDVYLDKRKVGTVIYKDMADQMNEPSSSGQGFDSRRSYSPTDLLDYK